MRRRARRHPRKRPVRTESPLIGEQVELHWLREPALRTSACQSGESSAAVGLGFASIP